MASVAFRPELDVVENPRALELVKCPEPRGGVILVVPRRHVSILNRFIAGDSEHGPDGVRSSSPQRVGKGIDHGNAGASAVAT